jgi:hypothetical protein
LRLYAGIGALSLIVLAAAWQFYVVRSAARWFASSHRYKAEVLAQPASAVGTLKHIQWDGWGWAGQDTTVYLVFDPADSLSAAARSHRAGKFKGLPCEVDSVSRLETHWYTVQFYTNEFWGRHDELDCTADGE